MSAIYDPETDEVYYTHAICVECQAEPNYTCGECGCLICAACGKDSRKDTLCPRCAEKMCPTCGGTARDKDGMCEACPVEEDGCFCWCVDSGGLHCPQCNGVRLDGPVGSCSIESHGEATHDTFYVCLTCGSRTGEDEARACTEAFHASIQTAVVRS